MSEVGGLYFMSIYESSLAVQYFSLTACCTADSVARRQFLRSYTFYARLEDVNRR